LEDTKIPLIALLPAIIGAGGMIGSSLINKSGKGSKTPLLPPGLDQNALLSTIGQQKDLSSFLTNEGKTTLGQGHDTLHAPLKFYGDILGGDRTAMMETLAPEIAAINAQFKAPLKEAGLTSRGSALMPDLEASRQSSISDLFFKERPAAADKLTGIAQNLMNIGTSQLGLGADTLGSAARETLDYNAIIRGIQAKGAEQSSQMFGALGNSLGPILQKILGGGTGKTNPVLNLPGVSGDASPTFPGFPGIDASQLTDSGLNPALINSLINLGSGGAPEFSSSWLDSMRGGKG
jgi:hypothetical protein